MGLIMGSIGPEQLELFAHELRKIAELNLVYTRVSTDMNQSAPNLGKMYVTLRSCMHMIMVSIGPEQLELLTRN